MHASFQECVGWSGNVVLASLQNGWGGGEVYLSTLAAHLRERGLRVRVIVRAASDMQKFCESQSFEVFPIHGHYGNPLNLLRLRRWLRRMTPAVLHCNDSHALTCAGLSVIGLSSIRVVAMRHTMFPIRSVRKYCRLADHVVGVSHAVVDACEDRGIPRSHLRVIHAGIDFPVVHKNAIIEIRREFLTHPKQRLIVAVGNLLACKGHIDLIRAAKILKSRGFPARTIIAGEGEERSALKQQITQLDLEDEVVLAGFRTDANDLLAAADVVAHPAYNEGLCLTVAAALMLQRPVVCTAVGGLNEVIGADVRMNARSRFANVVEPADAIQLANSLQDSLNLPPSPETRRSAAEFAIEHFSAQRMAVDTIQLYYDIWNASAVAA